ncbi:zinc finger, CCHC-type containing protein [Tanacetum coccineum]
MLQELKTMYATQAEHELLQTMRAFHTCKQEEGRSVSSYVLKMKRYIDNLERLSHPVSLHLGVSIILVGLSKEYDNFVQNYNMYIMGKTVNELHEETLQNKDASLILHAIKEGKVQKHKNKKPFKAAKGVQGNRETKLVYAPKYKPSHAPKIKNPPPPKKDNPANDVICHQCGEVGHWRRNCLVYLTQLLKNKKLSQGASTSGVKAIRSYHLCLPSGLVVVLNNYHYAPPITRGIISVSRLFDDGFINHFENNAMSVSRNNLVYFSAIPRDGIYEIDLSSSNTNDSSMYDVCNKRAKLNLDSSLLWHRRLGHISKKCIKELQHDRLLNSIDVGSLGKCVSCMSGKIVRKPIDPKP